MKYRNTSIQFTLAIGQLVHTLEVTLAIPKSTALWSMQQHLTIDFKV